MKGTYISTSESETGDDALGVAIRLTDPVAPGSNIYLETVANNEISWELHPVGTSPSQVTVRAVCIPPYSGGDLYMAIGDDGTSCVLSTTAQTFTVDPDGTGDLSYFMCTTDDGDLYLTYDSNDSGTQVTMKPKNPGGSKQKWKYTTVSLYEK